jgi:ABC-type dipeptide/oligopeptide/nickel transport system ATPase subunit
MPEQPQHLLEVRGLCKTHTQGHWWQHKVEVPALDQVDLTLDAGHTLAVIGESGAGKTTLAMCLVGLERPDAGEMRFDGRSLLLPSPQEYARATQDIQLIFQDSAGALSPRMSAVQVVEEPLLIRGRQSRKERSQRALEAMQQVGLPATWKSRRPHELSGGQRQRLAIARALVTEPRLLILDEALAGLDLSIQGQIINLLVDLQAARGLSYLYISHNRELVARIADEIMILDQGRVIERIPASAFADLQLKHTPASVRSTPRKLSFAAHGGA